VFRLLIYPVQLMDLLIILSGHAVRNKGSQFLLKGDVFSPYESA